MAELEGKDAGRERSTRGTERRAQEGLKSLVDGSNASVQQFHKGVEEGEWRMNGEEMEEEASPDWSDASEGEEEEEEEEGEGKRTVSGYTLLPQDIDRVNGNDRGTDTLESLEADSPVATVSPRMTRWLQKQVNDMTISSGSSTSSKTAAVGEESTDWAKFSEPEPSNVSQDWASGTVPHETTGTPSSSTETADKVEPASTMEEGTALPICPILTCCTSSLISLDLP